mmetsp:Transcript_12418/g.24141  ORF Transcript_12418/g.24141 Transcript_12418/m.24141 type:complete len:225 (+) Transcript_12418:85-759(+)
MSKLLLVFGACIFAVATDKESNRILRSTHHLVALAVDNKGELSVTGRVDQRPASVLATDVMPTPMDDPGSTSTRGVPALTATSVAVSATAAAAAAAAAATMTTTSLPPVAAGVTGTTPITSILPSARPIVVAGVVGTVMPFNSQSGTGVANSATANSTNASSTAPQVEQALGSSGFNYSFNLTGSTILKSGNGMSPWKLIAIVIIGVLIMSAIFAVLYTRMRAL